MPNLFVCHQGLTEDAAELVRPKSLHQIFDFLHHLGQDPRNLFWSSTKPFLYGLSVGVDDKDWGNEINQVSGDNFEVGSLSASLKSFKAWRLKNTLRKIFHPGNSLAIALILSVIGLSLLVFGIACPPALVFVALGFTAFSAVTAIIYAAGWLKVEALVFRNIHPLTLLKDFESRTINESSHSVKAVETSSYDDDSAFEENVETERRIKREQYIAYSLSRLTCWIAEHKLQATLMVIGAVLFLATLIVAILASFGIGFGVGLFALTAQFFISAGLPSLLCSALSVATLTLAPTILLDTTRRMMSGIYAWATQVFNNPIETSKNLQEEVENLNLEAEASETENDLNHGAVSEVLEENSFKATKYRKIPNCWKTEADENWGDVIGYYVDVFKREQTVEDWEKNASKAGSYKSSSCSIL